jgi:phosphatidylinositol kinase/protein kinase (PI-3  family)
MPDGSHRDRLEAVAESDQLTVQQQHLRSAWDTSQISTGDDWREWIRRFAIECLKESPSHALRSCRTLADSVCTSIFHQNTGSLNVWLVYAIVERALQHQFLQVGSASLFAILP